jgi:hypothetical protein
MLKLFRRLCWKAIGVLERLRFGKKTKSKPKDHPDIYPLW